MLHNIVALYGVQVGRKIIPLITIPYLARVLGAAGGGEVAFVTAASEFLVLFIEFGFNLSATREVARNRDCPHTCGQIMSGVLGAQAILAILGCLAFLLAAPWIPILRDRPALYLGGLVYGVTQGFAPLWFFQGLERLRLSSALEIGGKIATLLAMFVLVQSPDDGWKWMMLCAAAPTVTTIGAFILAFRTIPLVRPTVALVRDALQMGWPMFVFRSAESLYVVGNAFLLGLFATPEVVGYFASGEKISRAAFGLLNPVRDAIFPRLSHLAKRGGHGDVAPLARIGATVMTTAGFLLGLTIFITAPITTKLLLGGEFGPAVSVLRIMSCLPLLLAITHSFGMQWLIPFGKESVVNRIIIAAGLLNVTLAIVLAPRYAHIGMACAVVCSELFVCVSMAAAALRSRPEMKTGAMIAVVEG